MINKKWMGLLIGLLFGITIGIMPFFTDIFCHLNEKCNPIFMWPWYLFLLPAQILGMHGDQGMFVLFLAPVFYPIFGMIVGFIIGKKIKNSSN